MIPTKSRKELRQERILSALEANPALRVNQLAEALEVSTETIRRDLSELEQTGRLSRTYGGAVSNANRFEPALSERLVLKQKERRAIAQAAVQCYAQEEALLLGGGATMVHFARALRQIERRMTVITPAYTVAVELSLNPLIDIVLLPGMFEVQEHIVWGSETIHAIERYRVGTAIIGASGVNADGVSDALLKVGEVYSAIVHNTQRCAVLADSSKFDKRALMLVAEWSPRITLFTDAHPQGSLKTALANSGAGTVVVNPDQE